MTDQSEEVPQSKPEEKREAGSDKLNLKMSGGSTVKRAGRRGRRPSKVDVKVKLERSRQSARECRARKKLRYQYLEELVNNRERAVYALRSELQQLKEWCEAIDKGETPEGLKKALAALPSPVKLAPEPNSKRAVSKTTAHETTSSIFDVTQGDPLQCTTSTTMAEENPAIPTVVNIHRTNSGVRLPDGGHTKQTRPKRGASSATLKATRHSAIPTVVSSYRVDDKVRKRGKRRKPADFQQQLFPTTASESIEIQPEQVSTEITNSPVFYRRDPNEKSVSAEWIQSKKKKSSHLPQKVASTAVPMTKVWSEPMATSEHSVSSTSSPSFTSMLNSHGIEVSGGWAQDDKQRLKPLDVQQLLSSTVMGGSDIWSERASPPMTTMLGSQIIPASDWPQNKTKDSFLVQPDFVSTTEPMMVTWPETTVSLPMSLSAAGIIPSQTVPNMNGLEVPGTWEQGTEQDRFSLEQSLTLPRLSNSTSDGAGVATQSTSMATWTQGVNQIQDLFDIE